MERKPFWQTRRFWGLVIGILPQLLLYLSEQLQWGWTAEDANTIAETVANIVTTIGGLVFGWGTIEAQSKIGLSGRKPFKKDEGYISVGFLSFLMIVVFVFGAMGCGGKNYSASDATAISVDLLSDVYEGQVQSYLTLKQTLPDNQAQELEDKVAPYLDKAGVVLIALRDSVAFWKAAIQANDAEAVEVHQEAVEDYRKAAANLLDTVVLLFMDIAGGYYDRRIKEAADE